MSETAVESAAETSDAQAEQLLAEAVAQPEQHQQDDAKPDTGSKAEPDWKAEAEKWKALSRRHESNAKANAEAAKKYAEWEESQKSEQQKLLERLEAAERERDEERRGRARLMAAAAYSLPASLLDRIGGATEEEITESAQALAAEIDAEVARRVEAEVARRGAETPTQPAPPARRRPVEVLMPGAMPANAEPVDGNEAFRRFLSGGRR